MRSLRLEYAPITRAQLAEGTMTVDELAHAAITVSNNTAANLLLVRVDRPPASRASYARRQEDAVTRLDRNEPSLNDKDPGDPRDTT